MKLNCLDIFVAISTDQVEILTDFYRQLLHKAPKIDRPPAYAEFAYSNLRLAIFKPKTKHQEEFANHNSSISLCLEVESLDKAIAHIADLGCPPPGKIIEASHGREIYAYDPDGNRLILHQSA